MELKKNKVVNGYNLNVTVVFQWKKKIMVRSDLLSFCLVWHTGLSLLTKPALPKWSLISELNRLIVA